MENLFEERTIDNQKQKMERAEGELKHGRKSGIFTYDAGIFKN